MPETMPDDEDAAASAGFPGVDPTDDLAASFMQKLDGLEDADIQVLARGITPPLAAVLTKLLPGTASVWQTLGADDQGGATAEPAMPAPPPAGGPQSLPKRPTSALASI